jgi:DNA-binding transcriptional MocR family regulator
MGTRAAVAIAEEPRALYERLADDLAGLVATGTLKVGDRLPSVRRLSRQRGVSISTVLQAYLQLESRGVVETRPQSGHYVRAARLVPTPEPRPPRSTAQATRVTVSDLVARVYGAAREPGMVLLGAAHMSPALLPTDAINRRLAAVARTAGGAGIGYDIPPGLPALRRQVARRAAESGVAATADDVVTTFGTMEALHLCLRAVTVAGDTIAIESPGYYGVLQLIESLGLRALEIPAHPGTGVDLDALGAALRPHKVKACLLATNFANPLGTLMSDDAKQALVRLLAQHEIPLIEDDIYGDLHHDGTRPRPAKAFDRQGLVMLCASFSKTLAPGYRVGYTLPGRFRERVERLKFAQTLGTATLPQMAIADFLENGGYERHLRRLRRALAEQVARTSAAISASFPAGTRLSRPRGGYVLWVEMPPGKNALTLHARAHERGISIAPGPIFSAKPRFSNCLRISAGFPWSDTIERSVAVLGQIASAL